MLPASFDGLPPLHHRLAVQDGLHVAQPWLRFQRTRDAVPPTSRPVGLGVTRRHHERVSLPPRDVSPCAQTDSSQVPLRATTDATEPAGLHHCQQQAPEDCDAVGGLAC